MAMLEETIKSVNDIKNPQTRLNILMPIAAAVVLFAFCVRLFFMLIHSDGSAAKEQKEKIRQLENRNEIIINTYQARIDAANVKFDSIQSLRYDESQARINEYQKMLKVAESVQTKIEKLKAAQ